MCVANASASARLGRRFHVCTHAARPATRGDAARAVEGAQERAAYRRTSEPALERVVSDLQR